LKGLKGWEMRVKEGGKGKGAVDKWRLEDAGGDN